MLKKTTEFRLAEWKKILTEVNNSGISKRAWCKANGIDERRLYYWQNRIWKTEATGDLLPAKKETSDGADPSSSQGCFVELDIPATTQCPGPQPVNTGIVLQCSDCRIFITDGVSEAALTTVLRAVRNA